MRTPDAFNIGEVIRKRRRELQLSQAELATKTGVAARQIRRYEAGEQQPLLSVGVAIAQALDIPVTELTGLSLLHRISLAGEWSMAWQTYHEGNEVLALQQVLFTQHDDLIHLRSLSRGNIDLDAGGYNWQGQLRLWDNKTLLGHYVADDQAVNSKGTLFFTFDNHGTSARGGWMGVSHDSDFEQGFASFARDEATATETIQSLTKDKHSQEGSTT